MSDQTTVTLAGVAVPIEVPDAVAFYRVWASATDTPTKTASVLRICWRGPNRPAHSADARDVEETGVAVIRELLKRGASMKEVDAASWAAFNLCHRAYMEGTETVEDTADFSEAPADGSESI